MVELIEFIVGAVLIGGAAYVVVRGFGGEKQKKMQSGGGGGCPCSRSKYGLNYGTIPLPENVESWLYVKNPETRGANLVY